MDAILGPSHTGGHIELSDIALPGACRVVFDRDARLLADGRALLGGSPLRLLRLTAEGAATVRLLRDGVTMAEVGADKEGSRARLVRRLLATGMVHPRQGTLGPSHREVTVVVPVRDRASDLARLLAHVGPVGEVIVVDDGSLDDSAEVAARGGARVIQRAHSGGPAAARNTGLGEVATSLVAFIDSDCEPAPGWLDRVLGHFEDPAVVAVAPRVVEPDHGDGSVLARYEETCSPLDLGSGEGPVLPRSRISYVPSAALVVRREIAQSLGGFDENLTTGEDVDFVWRMIKAGGIVRYEPASRVAHHHRTSLLPLLGRRFAYGRAAAPLAKRHPDDLVAIEVSRWTFLAWGLGVLGYPSLGVAVAGGSAAVLSHRMSELEESEGINQLGFEMARLAIQGHWAAGRLLASAIMRTWLPVFIVAAVFSRRARLVLFASAVIPALAEWAHRRPRLDPLRYIALRVLDDASYAAGVWEGCITERTIAPLLPHITGKNK